MGAADIICIVFQKWEEAHEVDDIQSLRGWTSRLDEEVYHHVGWKHL